MKKHFKLMVLMCFIWVSCESERPSNHNMILDMEATSVNTDAETFDVEPLDVEPPTWPESAHLSVVKINANRVVLTWTAATDNHEIAEYELQQDGVTIATKVAHQLGGEILGLSPSTDYVFQVVAIDGSGNRSEGGPSIMVSTPDELSPLWPNGSTLMGSEVSESALRLSWSDATDDVEVTQYRLYLNHVELDSVLQEQTSYVVTGLTPEDIYTFRVEAEDAQGNLSVDGPSLTTQLSDLTPPVWSENMQLLTSELTPNSVTLGWTSASDNVGVTQYVVRQNETLIGDTEAMVTWLTVGELSPWTEYLFTVEARDGANNHTMTPLSTRIFTPDHGVPSWGDDVALVVSDPQVDQITLSWPPASDDVAVTSYRVYQGLVLIAETDADHRTWTALSLAQDGIYSFSVQALDAAGNESRDGPTLQVQLNDQDPPRWEPEATLIVTERTDTSITLSWPMAMDNVMVVAYALFMNEQFVLSVDGETTSIIIEELTPDTEYQCRVQARDAGGNQSIDGPELNVTTLPALSMGPTTAEVYTGLRPSCGPCHYSGSAPNTAYFTSEEMFQQMVVDNPELVVPGHPDDSSLVQLLEGTATGIFVQMPPSGETFASRAEAGNTDITMEAIRQWITEL